MKGKFKSFGLSDCNTWTEMPHRSSLYSEGLEHSGSPGVPISSLPGGQRQPDSTAALPGQTPLPIVLAGVSRKRSLTSTCTALLQSSSPHPAMPPNLLQRESKSSSSVYLVCDWGKWPLCECCGGPSGNHSSPVSPGTLCHCQTLSYGKQMRITDLP